jgi:predicted ATPase
MPQLQALAFQPTFSAPSTFPFSLPIVQTLDMRFTQAVTFFVGENGSGKSTILEAIACGAHLPTVGSQSVDSDPTLASARELAQAIRWQWSRLRALF